MSRADNAERVSLRDVTLTYRRDLAERTAERDAARAQNAAARARHRANDYGYCEECEHNYPCGTARDLDPALGGDV